MARVVIVAMPINTLGSVANLYVREALGLAKFKSV